MMGRWGLEGMASFENARVAEKEVPLESKRSGSM